MEAKANSEGGKPNERENKERLSDIMIWIVLIVLVILVGIINPKFLTIANLRTLLTGESISEPRPRCGIAILTRGRPVDRCIRSADRVCDRNTGTAGGPGSMALANPRRQVPYDCGNPCSGCSDGTLSGRPRRRADAYDEERHSSRHWAAS